MGSRYLLNKIVQAIGTIFLIIILNFVLFRMMPGSPDRVLLRNPNITTEVRDAARARWGLDQPLPVQLVKYIGSTLQGDLGYSIRFQGLPVTEVLAGRLVADPDPVRSRRVHRHLLRAGPRRLHGLETRRRGRLRRQRVIARPLFDAVLRHRHDHPRGLRDRARLVPDQRHVHHRGAPTTASGEQIGDFAWHLALPVITVAIGLIGQYSILMRSSVIDTLGEDYVTTARAKGLSDGNVLRAHALPNALLPAVTLVAINLGFVIGGAITVEVVFNWPGLGTLTVDAVTARDYPVLQGIFLLLSISVVAANLVADIVYGGLDPRVRA